MIYLPKKAIICCRFNVVITTVNPVDALCLNVQCDTRWPSQFAPNDSIPIGAIHEGTLQTWLSIQSFPICEEHIPVKGG